jgi:hypothetical protein
MNAINQNLLGVWKTVYTEVKSSESTNVVYYFLKNGLWIWQMPDWNQSNKFVILRLESKPNYIRWIRQTDERAIKSKWIKYSISDDKNSLTITHQEKKTYFSRSNYRKYPLPKNIKEFIENLV